MKNCLLTLLALFLFTPLTFSQTIQWEQLNGPFGGTALSFVTNSNGDIFAGADQDQGGIFRSTDAGLTWQPKSAGLYLSNRAFNWLVVDDSSYIIAGTSSHIGNKVYKSKDNGESWNEIANLGGKNVAVNDSGHIYVGNTASAQYSVSKDGGYTWTHYSSPAGFTFCITFNDSGHIFIGGNYTGYRSTDNGASWTSLGPMGLPSGVKSIAVDTNGNLYAGCSREFSTNSGVFRSTDNGDSWTPVKQGFLVNSSHNIVINNVGDIIVGSYGWGIWKSTDEGTTWTQQNKGLGHLYIEAMHISVNGYVYAGTSGGGVYRSTDNGERWVQVGIIAASVKNILISDSNDDIFTAVSGVSHSTDYGLNWIPGGIGLSSYDVKSLAIKDDYVFAGTAQTNYGSLFRSSDNGVTWVRSDNGLSNSHTYAVTVSPSGELFAGRYPGGIFSSTDNGDTWVNKNYGVTLGEIRSVEFNSSGDAFVASWGQGVFRQLAGDTVWTQMATGYYTCLFIASNDYIYAEHKRSSDNGDTWTNMSFGSHRAYSFAENLLGHLFAGTYDYGSGVFRSTDYGETWESISTGLPTLDVRSVAVDSYGYLYAGPLGYSLYKTTTSTVTSVDNEKQIPSYFSLEQNYPNPFNPSTKISWHSPIGSWQTIKLFDVLGREIETIADGYYDAGSHSTLYIVNSTLPSGVYFYQLKAGNYIQTKKMILLR